MMRCSNCHLCVDRRHRHVVSMIPDELIRILLATWRSLQQVKSALPAIDVRAPAARAHVSVKLKKWQREAERRRRIERDNYSLLQRLTAVMQTKRLDNRWEQPLPNFHHKVGVFYDADALRGRLEARALTSQASEESYAGHVKCFACYSKRKTALHLNKTYGASGDSLPFI